jgi:hypothetical protein
MTNQHKIDAERGALLAELCKWRDADKRNRSVLIDRNGLTIEGPGVARYTVASADPSDLKAALRYIERSQPIEVPKDALHLVAELKESLGQGRVA